jgi:Xaa-Pro aminopeptidase
MVTPQEVRPGRLMGEIDLVVAARLVQEAAERFPGEQVEVMCRSLSGPSSAAPHGSGAETGAMVATGHVMVICVIVRVNGLMVENERTWFCGKPDEQQRKAFQAARDAQEAAIAELMPGRPVSAFDATAQSVLQRAGYGQCIIHRSGHGIGLAGHELPDDTAFNQRPLLHEVFSARKLFGVSGLTRTDSRFAYQDLRSCCEPGRPGRLTAVADPPLLPKSLQAVEEALL